VNIFLTFENTSHKAMGTEHSIADDENFHCSMVQSSTIAVETQSMWELLKPRGQVPSERSGHEVVLYDCKAYLFGGYGGVDQNHLSDFYCYDFALNAWKAIPCKGDSPSPRTAFSVCATPDGFIYLWGGTDHDLEGLEDQSLYQFHIQNKIWRKVEVLRPLKAANYVNLRYFGRSSFHHSGSLFYFGGGVKGGRFTNDLIMFNLQNKCWSKIETSGDIPCARYKHQSCVVKNKLFVIGGGCYLPPEQTIDVFVLCLESYVWSRVEACGQLPEGRAAHTCEYDPLSNSIYLWGGFNKALFPLYDLHKFDLNTYTWSACAIFKKKSLWPGRSFHSSCFFGGSLYSFGGSNGECRYDDLMRFQLYSSPPLLTSLAANSLGACMFQKNLQYLPKELRKDMSVPSEEALFC